MTETIEEADRLYEIEPDGFVAARNELVTELKAAGRKDDAAAVAKLRRPSPTAWALNQVARSDPDLVEQALEAGARLRDATDAAVGGDAGGLRAAATEERAATDALVDDAAAHLGGRGPAARLTLAETVRAAVLDASVADELRAGVLSADHEAPGFGFGLGLDDAAAPAAPRETKAKTKAPAGAKRSKETGDGSEDRAARKEREAAERRAQEEAEQREREARRARAAAEADAEKLAKRAARLAEKADRLAAEAEAARADADAAAEAADAARRALAD